MKSIDPWAVPWGQGYAAGRASERAALLAKLSSDEAVEAVLIGMRRSEFRSGTPAALCDGMRALVAALLEGGADRAR